MKRYPFAPLASAAGVKMGQVGGHQPGEGKSGMFALAEMTGVSTTTLKRARRRGLRWDQADAWACAVGVHPHHVWPSWVLDGLRFEPELEHLDGWGVPEVGERGDLVWRVAA